MNEISARYSILDNEFYIPAPAQLAAQSAVNRQGRGAVLEGAEAARVLDLLREDARTAYAHYAEMLNEDEAGNPADPARQGLARELARMNLSLNFYTQWYWKTDLHNLMHFLSLRADAHAQYEIRVYADAMVEVLDRWVPAHRGGLPATPPGRRAALGRSARRGAAHARGRAVTAESVGLSKREWGELMAVLERQA